MKVAFVLQIVQRVGEGIHNGELTFSHPRSRTHISAEGYGDKSDSLVMRSLCARRPRPPGQFLIKLALSLSLTVRCVCVLGVYF